ncbi:MAG TPA: HD domain-containing protein, partial [Acidobacteria bacterium]|nr:HD domain-containing protein [Acidobacteriota bacterium]
QEGLSRIVAAAADLATCPNLRVVAVTLWEDPGCQTIVMTSQELSEEEVAAIRRHQAEELRSHGRPVPADGLWNLLVRRVGQSFATVARSIATVGISAGPAGPLILTVAGDRPESTRRHLDGLVRIVEGQLHASELRYFQRRMVRTHFISRREKNDPLRRHGEHVSRLAWDLGRAMGLSGHELEETVLAGLVHDVGLDEVLGRAPYANPSPTAEERQMYRRHVQAGERQLRDMGLERLARLVRHHHERWDGSGYPDRLAGEAIPRACRIVHVAEVYDVLTSESSYRRTVPEARARAIIKAAAGSQFDPQVVAALEKVLP